MEDSILTSTKASLGLAEDHDAFDSEIITHLNSALSSLNQLGVGPDDGLFIEDDSAEWDELLDGDPRLNMAKSYIHLQVKLLFDPPEIGFVLTAMKEQIEKLEWRLMVQADPPTIEDVVVVSESEVVMDGGEI